MRNVTAPIDTAERVEAAGRLIAAGQAAAAETMLRDILQSEPGHPDALNTFASLALARNDGARAFEILGPACTAYPNHARLLANLGLAHFMLGRPGDAAVCLERAVANASGDAELRLALAQYRVAAGDADGGIAEVEAVLRNVPNHPAALAQLGTLALATGDRARGEAVLRRAAAIDPDNSDVLANLSTLCGLTSRHEEAAVLAERAHLRAPLDLGRLVLLASCRAMLGDLDRAAVLCKRVLVTAPEHLGATQLFGRIAVARGVVESGISTVSQLVRKQSKNPDAILALASLLRFAGRIAQALVFVDQALALAPDHQAARKLRLDLLLTLGRFADAWREVPPTGESEPTPRVLAVPKGTSVNDALLLGRFAADVGGEGLALASPAQSPATAVLQRMSGITTSRTAAPDDRAVTLYGLPPLVRATRDDVRRPRPPIAVDRDRLSRWQAAFESLPRPLIAIDWDPYAPGLTLRDLAPIVTATGTPVSFTTGEARHQLRDWPRIIDAGRHVESVDDVLAAMACVDAFVGTDGGPLHLAGALQVPGVALAAAGHPWWLATDEDRLLWYPSLRRLKQAAPGTWDDVAAALPDAIGQALAEGRVTA